MSRSSATNQQSDNAVAAVKKAFAVEERLASVHDAIAMTFDDSATLTMQGEVNSVAEKRIALERAAAIASVAGIVDRLRVRPAQAMEDKAIRRHICRALDEEAAFLNLCLKERLDGDVQTFRTAAGPPAGDIIVEADCGVVTLNGAVPSLAHKRLAGVLAWWVPGSRDVINGIAVDRAEEDGPDRIEEAVRIALDRDPYVNAGQIRVGARNCIIRLTGVATSAEQRHMAECDAWCVFGVDDVINRIEVIAA